MWSVSFRAVVVGWSTVCATYGRERGGVTMADQAVNDSPGHHIIGDGCTWVSETARVSLQSGQDVQSGVQSAADMANIAVRRNDRRSLARDRVLLVN